MGNADIQVISLMRVSAIICLFTFSHQAEDPSPKTWPEQFNAQLFQHKGGKSLSVTDLWYDWPNGRNFNIIQHQLSYKLYDLEWNNGTSYYFNLGAKTCKTLLFEVGILRPDWLVHSHYLGEGELNGFTCNVWEKEDFITYYEDKETQRPVGWLFKTTGTFIHVITFKVGAVLSEANWQAPSYCFTSAANVESIPGSMNSSLVLPSERHLQWTERWKRQVAAMSSLS